MASNFWTDEKTERLRVMYAEGASASDMARELGAKSRNAVVGKLHRLGCVRAAPAAPGKAEGKTKPARERRKAGGTQLGQVKTRRGGKRTPKDREHPPVIPPSRFAAAFVPPGGAELVEHAALTPRMCQWPYGETPPFQFCGKTRVDGRPYCAAHVTVAAAKPGYHPFEDDEAGDAAA